MIVPHPLDPITLAELRQAVKMLEDFFHGVQLRSKFIDIYECSKNEGYIIPGERASQDTASASTKPLSSNLLSQARY